MAEAYPLHWPSGWKRTTSRTHAKFAKRQGLPGTYRSLASLTIGDGLVRLQGELSRLGAQRVVISSNLRPRTDGLPIAGQATNIGDPGVAVYFVLGKKETVLACDRWISAADNMAAIAGHIAAIRMMDRYGVGTIEQAFAGYAALPPTAVDWRAVLGFPSQGSVTTADVVSRHRAMAVEHHPDKGGDANMMAKINDARSHALRELA